MLMTCDGEKSLGDICSACYDVRLIEEPSQRHSAVCGEFALNPPLASEREQTMGMSPRQRLEAVFALQELQPGMEKVYEMLKAYYPDLDPLRPYDGIYCWQHGIKAAVVMVEGVRAAMNKVGYENLSRRAIWEGLESLNNVDIMGLQKISYSPDDHTGCHGYGVYQYQKGDFKLVGDLTPGPPVADWEKAGKFKWAK